MSISDADIAFVKDHFAGVGTLSTRKMFGGLSIYADGVIFALIISTGALMIKVTGALTNDLAAEAIAAIHPRRQGHQARRHALLDSARRHNG